MEHIVQFYEQCKQTATATHVFYEALTDDKFKGNNDLRAVRHETLEHMQQMPSLARRVDSLIRDELTFYMPG